MTLYTVESEGLLAVVLVREIPGGTESTVIDSRLEPLDLAVVLADLGMALMEESRQPP